LGGKGIGAEGRAALGAGSGVKSPLLAFLPLAYTNPFPAKSKPLKGILRPSGGEILSSGVIPSPKWERKKAHQSEPPFLFL